MDLLCFCQASSDLVGAWSVFSDIPCIDVKSDFVMADKARTPTSHVFGDITHTPCLGLGGFYIPVQILET